MNDVKEELSNVKEKRRRSKFTNVIRSYDARTVFFAVLSLVVNVAFAVMNGVSAVKYSSLWYGALAGYYTVLILFKGGVVTAKAIRDGKRRQDGLSREKSALKIYLCSGAFLIILDVAMAVAVTQMVVSTRPVVSGQIMAISNAAFTFYSMTMAIVNLVKARRANDYVTQSLRNINLVAACMAMLSLTVSLIATFGGGADMSAMKIAVGAIACVAAFAVAVCMIARAIKLFKNYSKTDQSCFYR